MENNNTNDTQCFIEKMVKHYEKAIALCNDEIEFLTHPEKYGISMCACNSIVINKERMMTITTDKNHHTTYEFSPLFPTYFTPRDAKNIVEEDIYKDINGNILKLEIVGRLEYYRLLKASAEQGYNEIKKIM